MEDFQHFNEMSAVGVGAVAPSDAQLLATRCAVCGRTLADLDIDWGDAAADPAFYYVPTEAGAAQSIPTTILKS